MATKSGRSKIGTKKRRGSARKSVKPHAKRLEFYIMFKAKQSDDIYLSKVYRADRLTDRKLIPSKTLKELEEALSRLPTTVEFAHLLKRTAEIFRTCGPSPGKP